jgi:hypothetical protein
MSLVTGTGNLPQDDKGRGEPTIRLQICLLIMAQQNRVNVWPCNTVATEYDVAKIHNVL